jgi:hypothetical protein
MPRVPRIPIAALAVAFALVAPCAASADHGRPFADPDVEAYLEIAEAHWSQTAPTCAPPGGETIPVHVVLHDNPDPDVVATAEQPGCRMWLDRDWWPAPPSRMACTIIAHEWGHLLGFGHSADRGDLMYAEPLAGAPGCSLYEPRITLGTAVAQSSRPARRRRQRAARTRRLVPEHRTRRPGWQARQRAAARR